MSAAQRIDRDVLLRQVIYTSYGKTAGHGCSATRLSPIRVVVQFDREAAK